MAIGKPALYAPDLEQVISAHASLRQRNPLVQCLTNTVSANFVANALLAAGAAPAMVDNTQEAAMFARIADAVLINLGTPTDAQVAEHAAGGGGCGRGGVNPGYWTLSLPGRCPGAAG